MKKNQYLKYALNPVQEFIEPARTTSDMWAGSYILSYLMASIIVKLEEFINDTDVKFIYPFIDYDNNGILNLIKKKIKNDDASYSIPNLPNAFLIHYNGESNLVNIAEKLDEYLVAKLEEFAFKISEKIKNSSDIKVAKFHEARFLKQSKSILKSQWYVLDASSAGEEKDIERIEKLFAASKNTRTFNSWLGATGWSYGEDFKKDHLNGKEEVVLQATQDKNQKFFKRNEELGSTTLIKRMLESAYLIPKYDVKKFFIHPKGFNIGKEENSDYYYAIFALDGDNMGQILSGKKDLNGKIFKREETSKSLLEFSNSTREIVEDKYGGFLVYSGGDDVLAVIHKEKVIGCISALMDKFKETLKGATMSAGVAIAHSKESLQYVTKEARNAEKRAKNDFGKNAIAISLIKRSGETLHTGFKLDENGLTIHDLILKNTLEGLLSYGLSYKILKTLDVYQNKSVNVKIDEQFEKFKADIFIHEFERMLDQDENLHISATDDVSKKEQKKKLKEDLKKEFKKFADSKNNEMFLGSMEGLFLFIAWVVGHAK